MPGTAPKLNGWQRLGILLSVFWMIAVGIEWWVEVRQGPFSTGWVTDTVELNPAPPRPESSAALPYVLGPPVHQVVNIARFLVALIAPPIALWALGFSAVWVRRGFQGRNNSPGIATLEMSKAMLLVNGAASISTLTFMGNLKIHPTSALLFSMLLFATGAMFSAMIFAFAYFTQLSYGNANIRLAHKRHSWTYVVVIFSVAFFIAGIVFAAAGFNNLP